MLVFFFLVFICGIAFSGGKAFPEHSQRNYGVYRGYIYNQGEEPGFESYNYRLKFPTKQKEHSYIPTVNGQPIFVPPLSDSTSDIYKILKDYNAHKQVTKHRDIKPLENYKTLLNDFPLAWKYESPVTYNTNKDFYGKSDSNTVSENGHLSEDHFHRDNFKIPETTHNMHQYLGLKPSVQHEDYKPRDPIHQKFKSHMKSDKGKLKNQLKVATEKPILFDYYRSQGITPDENFISKANSISKKHADEQSDSSEIRTVSMANQDGEYDYIPIIRDTLSKKTISTSTTRDKDQIDEVQNYESQSSSEDDRSIKRQKPLEIVANKHMKLRQKASVDVNSKTMGSHTETPTSGVEYLHPKTLTKFKSYDGIVDNEKIESLFKTEDLPNIVLKVKKEKDSKNKMFPDKCTKTKSVDFDTASCSEKRESSGESDDSYPQIISKKTKGSAFVKSPAAKQNEYNPKFHYTMEKLKSTGGISDNDEETTQEESNYENVNEKIEYDFSLGKLPEKKRAYTTSNVQSNFPEQPGNSEFGLSQGSTPLTGETSEGPPFLKTDDKSRSLISSLNPNMWSLVFNPNAKDRKLKKCLNRENESGYCMYIQNCPIPNMASSLEQLLNNACVVDDMFIGICCPEFPVETIKVDWEQDQTIFNDKTVDELSHDFEGEFIKSWCDGYKQSLSNLLKRFSLTDCGTRSSEASKLNFWPWKASLISMSNGKVFCGGGVIAERYILTAAHCTTKIPKNQILVRLGQRDSAGEDFAVVEIKRHAQYNPRSMHNDIALLKLRRRIAHGHATAVCLPEKAKEHDKAILLGWQGTGTSLTSGSENSKKTEILKVMSQEECRKRLGVNVPDTTLCTEARSEHERTCNVDSGAPLIAEDADRYEVIGILSWNRNDCDQRFPSTFSRVSSYLGWIRKHAV